ncbi:hypothetical protein GQ53DRAFT_821055 [Thozetella sp. PMI_491]|nr:hypothetical protein GQ53DRAFT_821055 [Thozetella sp. PMI_491]
MTTSSDRAVEGVPPATSPKYRELDRSKDEIRLLRILPPEVSCDESAPLELAKSPIYCKLEYESLQVLAGRSRDREDLVNSVIAYLLQDLSSSGSDDTRDTAAAIDQGGRQFQRVFSLDSGATYEIEPKRREAIQQLYAASEETMQRWTPGGIEMKSEGFKDWLDSWIWTSPSGSEKHQETETLGGVTSARPLAGG